MVKGLIVAQHLLNVNRLEYPAVSPELSFLKETGRAEFHTITDDEALDGNSIVFCWNLTN